MLVPLENIFVAFAVLTTLIGILNSLNLLFMSEVGNYFVADSQFLVMLHFGVNVYLFDIFLFRM